MLLKTFHRIKNLKRNFYLFLNIPFNPIALKPMASKEKYLKLHNDAKNIKYSIIDDFEIKIGFKIDKEWLEDLALHTQVCIKNSDLNYQHGRILYSLLVKYINDRKDNPDKSLVIFETGTSRGFSSICMSKAITDSKSEGKIITVDALPHNIPIYWNVIDDLDKPKKRSELINKWNVEINRIVFIQGWTQNLLNKIGINRINFAFLDGSHTYKDIMREYNYVKSRQRKDDIIMFDDYSPNLFNGVVVAINKIHQNSEYKFEFIKVSNQRGYAIARKV